jgi:hypothetical protein
VHYYCLIGLLFLSQFAFIQSVQAQMYQWVDPESGTTQLSGKPPAWYRSVEGGPRVFVFNRGNVVDDTGINVSDEQRITLRTKAFISAEEDRLAAREKAIEAAKLKAAMARNAEEAIAENSEDSKLADESQDDLLAETPVEEKIMEAEVKEETIEEDISVEKMKALIAEWESKLTEEAKAKANTLLQQKGGGT